MKLDPSPTSVWGKLLAWVPSHRDILAIVSYVKSLIQCPVPSSTDAIPSLHDYLYEIISKSRISIGPLLVSLVYYTRLKKSLPPSAKGMACTSHRLILASLIIAEKAINDIPIKNKSWATYSVLLSLPLSEVNLMERQLLALLDFHIHSTGAEIVEALHIIFPAGIYGVLAPQIPTPMLVPISQYLVNQAQNNYLIINALDIPEAFVSSKHSPQPRQNPIARPVTENMQQPLHVVKKLLRSKKEYDVRETYFEGFQHHIFGSLPHPIPTPPPPGLSTMHSHLHFEDSAISLTQHTPNTHISPNHFFKISANNLFLSNSAVDTTREGLLPLNQKRLPEQFHVVERETNRHVISDNEKRRKL